MLFVVKRNIILYIIVICVFLNSNCEAEEGYLSHQPRKSPFQFTKNDLQLLMFCPAHEHGTLEEAANKLKKLVAEQPIDIKAAAWVCRNKQLDTLKVIGPLVDNVVLNSLVHTSTIPPEPNEVIWPGFDHPFINHLRQLRKVPNTKNLYAIINLKGEDVSFKERIPLFEEVKWMIYAVIGSDFQAVDLQNPGKICKYIDELHELEEKISVYKNDLGRSLLVNWVTDKKNIPVSARSSGSLLFVTALDSDYFIKSKKTNRVIMPIDLSPKMGKLLLDLPDGISVVSGKTINGQQLDLKATDGYITVDYSFYGGGELMLFEIKGF